MKKTKTEIDFKKLDEYIAAQYNPMGVLEDLNPFKKNNEDKNPLKNGKMPKLKGGSRFGQPSCANPMDNPKFIKIKILLEKNEDSSESFPDKLLSYIRLKKMTNAQAYNKAGIKPDCFSKIISGKTKRAEKNTVISLIIALGLNIEQAEDLLESAQYRLREHSKSYIIVRFCIENSDPNNPYSIDDVNIALAHYKQPLLGGVE